LHALLLVCAFCAGVSGNLFDTAALVTNVKNFANDRWVHADSIVNMPVLSSTKNCPRQLPFYVCLMPTA
jgi:hypothetical protein